MIRASVIDDHHFLFFLLSAGLRASPVNIVATATVVTDEALLEEDEIEGSVGGIDVESVATDKSTNDPDDEEVDVDVEECSSVDEGPVSCVSPSSSCDNAPTSGNRLKRRKSSLDLEQDLLEEQSQAPPSRKKRRQAPPMCNSEELRDVECHLETKELWDKFNDLGTEMIITKTGR